MPFLTLLGIAVPVSSSTGATVDVVRQGAYGRAFTGNPFNAVRSTARDYKGRTTLMPRATSISYEQLVSGEGESFLFAGTGQGSTAALYSTKGLGRSALVGNLTDFFTFATGGPVSNGGYLEIQSEDETRMEFATGYTSLEWTISTWLISPSAGALDWEHYVMEVTNGSIDSAWKDGATAGSVPDELATLASNLPTIALANAAGFDGTSFAELVALPYHVSDLASGWHTYMYNSGVGRSVDLPFLPMGGDWPRGGSATVLGEVLNSRQVDASTSGTIAVYEEFDFNLRARPE